MSLTNQMIEKKAIRCLILALMSILAISPQVTAQTVCDDWQDAFEINLGFLISEYQSNIADLPPGSALATTYQQRINDWQDFLLYDLPSTCPPSMSAGKTVHWSTPVSMGPTTMTLIVHTEFDFRSAPAKEETENILYLSTYGKQRFPIAFVSNNGIYHAERQWISEIRSPDNLIRNSNNGNHKIQFSGSSAYVLGGYMGQCHIVGMEDLIRFHQNTGTLTLHLPMKGIYGIFDLPVTTLTSGLLHDVYTYYQSNETAFLDLFQDFMNGDPDHSDFRNQPERILDPADTTYRVEIKINGVFKRAYGPTSGKKVILNLIT